MTAAQDPAEPTPDPIAASGAEPIEAGAAPAAPPPEGPPPAAPALPPRRRSVAGPVLGVIGFLVLAAAIAWLWRNPPAPPPNPAQTQALAALDRQVAAMATEVRALDQRVTALAARKPPAPPNPVDLGPVEARLTALEHRPAPTPAPPADMATKADVSALGARIDALAQKEGSTAALGKQLGAQGDTLARTQASTAALGKRVDGLEQTAQTRAADLATINHEVATLQAGAAGIERLARLQAAAAALDAGAPIGTIPDAPPALARYAATPPPTLSALRLSFPAAARAAAEASRPDVADKSLLSRMWARVRNVVTVRQGNQVVVGNPASGPLAAAQTALDAGDLAGAVVELAKLQGPAALAMGDWLAQARALLAARAAIAQMQAHA